MWEIYAYQNSDSLFGIFNAIAAIRGSNTYLSAIAAVTFCGFIAALLAYAFAPHKLQGWQWLASVVLVYAILFVPRVTVGIVDKTGGAPVKVVDNVPFGVALFGSLTSTIGNTLTELFETAFQVIPGNPNLPSELTYQKNGLMFGNRLIRETGKVVFQDPNFRTDLVNFIHNCTMYDLVDGTLDPTVFARADDVWGLMATPNPARFTTLTSSGGGVSTDTCPNVYNDLNLRIPAQISFIQGKLATQMNPTLPGAAAAGVIAAQIHQAYLKNNIANAAATAADIIRQNAVINAVNDTSQLIGQKTNDPASMVLAVGRAQAIAQTNAAWINSGKIAEQALPVVRNVVEALAYAIFPIMVLLLFLTGGRETMLALKNYIAVLIWIQLWPPLYAILNYMASMYAASELAAAANVGSGLKALSLQTASAIYANAISSEAVVGYLTISIPFIAWAALKRMENLGNTVVGGLTGLQSTAAMATGASAVGNVSMGNVAMDQIQLAPNRTSAFMSSQQSDMTGNTVSANALNGRTAVSLLRNQGFASRVVSMKVSEQDVVEANQSAEAARSELVSAHTERSAMLADVVSKGTTQLHSSRNSQGNQRSSFEEMGSGLDRLDQITKGVAEKTGLSQHQVAQIAFGAAAHVGVATPGFSPVKAGLQANANAGKSYSSGLSADQQKVLNALTQEQLSEFKKFGDRVSRDQSWLQAASTDQREASDLSSRLASVTARAQRAQASYGERTARAERLSSARERGETVAIDLAQDPHNVAMFLRYAEQYGGNSAAAFALLESELARQALRPNRVFSDGAAMPASFTDVKAHYTAQADDPLLTPGIDAQGHADRARVANKPAPDLGAASQGQQSASTPSAIREQVMKEGTALRGKTSAAQAGFDNAAQIVPTQDGTLSSRRSLLKQAGKQVVEDGGNTADNAKDIVKDLLKKKKE
ncbi:MAG TPA: conjugal transfer protein TraG [Oxalobacteraceae bacterium]|nr:conjugal transfer protein TraG [Oxalobacteraceae bacterium]